MKTSIVAKTITFDFVLVHIIKQRLSPTFGLIFVIPQVLSCSR